jgi:hypothetical protein
MMALPLESPMSGYIPPGRVRQIARLSIEVEILRNKIAGLMADLDRLDATVERLGQERARGMTRGALDILRRAGQPMGLRAITVALMTDKGMATIDPALVNRTMEKLRVSLTRQWQHGIVTRENGPRLTAVWSVAK